jgi:hypothetical protein
VGEERRLLVDRGDPERLRGLRIVVRDAAAGDVQRAGIRALRAGDDLDQGRLAGAVLPDEGVHLSRAQVERHARQGAHAGK